MDIEREIEQIQDRNKRVELDKALETSFVRRGFIASSTYLVASIWLILINESTPWLKALIPAVGYIFSTLSLPFVKKWWVKNR